MRCQIHPITEIKKEYREGAYRIKFVQQASSLIQKATPANQETGTGELYYRTSDCSCSAVHHTIVCLTGARARALSEDFTGLAHSNP